MRSQIRNTIVCCFLFFASLGAQSQAEPHAHDAGRIVVILAHPDDELVFAPALHRTAREGSEIELVFATTGDQGAGISQMKRGDALGQTRMREAECSARALGARQVISLNLGDGRLGIEARKPGSAAKRLLEKLPELVAGAQTVITFGPEGGYGHSDHRMTGAIVTQHVQSLAPEARPDLVYPALIHGPLPAQLAQQGWTLTAPDLAGIRTRYDGADLAAANSAAQCYITQFDEQTRSLIVPGFDRFVWQGEVSFRRAF